MKPHLLVISVLSCIALAKLQNQNNAAPTEDLVTEYYAKIDLDQAFTEQDDIDAKTIFQSDLKKELVAGIMMSHDKPTRSSIQTLVVLEAYGLIYSGNKIPEDKLKRLAEGFVDLDYRVKRKSKSENVYKNLLFGLTYDECKLLSQYLFDFLLDKDETWINITVILIKDFSGVLDMHQKYINRILRESNGFEKIYSIEKTRKDQRKPFKNMLKVWFEKPRDLIEDQDLDQRLIEQIAKDLKTEYEDGCWKENRDQIELVLMRKSIKYARAIMKKFEEDMGSDKHFENMINACKDDHDLNHDLADTYSSLARYIKNKHEYIAVLLKYYSDDKSNWSAWIMCITVVRPEEWPKIDEIFKTKYNGESLSTFIMRKFTGDKLIAEMMAAAVDSKFKPTTFTRTPPPANPPTSSAHPPS